MADLIVRYIGQEITISEDYLLAREIQLRFENLSEQAEEDYELNYYNKYENFLNFASTGVDEGYDYIANFADTAADILIKHGVYYADRKMLLNKYGEEIFREWALLDAAVNVKQDQAQARVDAERQAREYRKASRGRMVGGGFGIKGAVKGMAMAGTYNAASGLLHSGANAIGNSISRSNSKKELQHLYENELRESVGIAIKICVQVIGIVTIAELGLDVPDGIEERITTLFKNFSKVPKEDQPRVAAQIIALAPWDARTYMLLLPKFGDPDGELYKLAKQASMGMLTSFNSVRKDVLSKTIRSLQPEVKSIVAKTAIEDFDNAEFSAERRRLLSVVEEKAKWLGCQPGDDLTSQNLKSLDWEFTKLCREKEEATRTTNGVVYKTRELAEKARANIQEAQKLAQACKNADYHKLCDNLQKINVINDREPTGTVFDFIVQVEDMEASLRTVEGIEYNTYELAVEAKANRTSAKQLINSFETGNMKKDELLQEVHSLNQSEPQGSVSDIFDEMLTRHFDWKNTENPKAFKGIVSNSIADRQILQYEYYLFLEKYPPEADSWESLLIKLEKMDHVLQDDKEPISPQARQLLKSFVETAKKTTNGKIDAEREKKQAEKKEKKTQKRCFLLDIIALAAMLFFPLVEIAGNPCSFFGIIQSIFAGPSSFLVGAIFIAIYAVFFFTIIAASLVEPKQGAAGVLLFAIITGILCLICGDNYNVSTWLYILGVLSIVGLAF